MDGTTDKPFDRVGLKGAAPEKVGSGEKPCPDMA